jgi:hypothetical protein
LLLVVLIVGGVVYLARQRTAERARQLADAESEARRWVDRLGGSVLNLQGDDDASRQAMADASERYNAAGSQLEGARTAAQYRQVTESAYEGLYYVRAARTAMGLDPGPELPPLPGQQRAGAVTEARDVDVEGRSYSASPGPSGRNPHYYPGGMVSGRPVPAGWYSEPWWKTALVAGAWGVGSYLLFDALFSGMDHTAYADGFTDGVQALDGGADLGGWDGGNGWDGGGSGGGDVSGADVGDVSGADVGDFGGGDFGGGDFGGGFDDFGGGGDFS